LIYGRVNMLLRQWFKKKIGMTEYCQLPKKDVKEMNSFGFLYLGI